MKGKVLCSKYTMWIIYIYTYIYENTIFCMILLIEMLLKENDSKFVFPEDWYSGDEFNCSITFMLLLINVLT
jgi:hypothetical protein